MVGSNDAGGSSIVNNTFVNNSGRYGGGLYLNVYTIANVYNNIIYGNTALFEGGDLVVGGGTITKLFNNDFTNLTVWSTPLSQGNNINSSPNLTADFQLQSGSPCINTGDNSAPSLPATDFEGNPRIFGGVVDIGANEFFVSGPYADLSVSNKDNPDRVLINQEVTYTITITNLGTATAGSVTLTDTLPPTSTFVSATPTQGTCSESSQIVTCNIGPMASGATVTDTIVIDAPGTGGTITNVALGQHRPTIRFPQTIQLPRIRPCSLMLKTYTWPRQAREPVTMRMVRVTPALAQARMETLRLEFRGPTQDLRITATGR